MIKKDTILEEPGWDPIPHEEESVIIGPDTQGLMQGEFCAFNTRVTLISFIETSRFPPLFESFKDHCRRYERVFSRTLPHSDISVLNNSAGSEVEISSETYQLLKASQYYCEESQGTFDITIGSLSRLWDFRNEVIPDNTAVEEALTHVNWRNLLLRTDKSGETERYYARIEDPLASIDLGGIAKGYIADATTELLKASGMDNFIVNLGGNVITHGRKPSGTPWRIGMKNPRDKEDILGFLDVVDASMVTSGIYERCFFSNGNFYHHILDPATGFPVKTDVAGVTVIAEKSLDAEGFSTVLLALGIAEGVSFAYRTAAIIDAYFIDSQGKVFSYDENGDLIVCCGKTHEGASTTPGFSSL